MANGFSKSTFDSRPVHPSIRAKNPDHLYSPINHCRTTANLSNQIFAESWWHTLSTDPQGWQWQRQIHTERQIQRQRRRKFQCSSVNVYRVQCPLAHILCLVVSDACLVVSGRVWCMSSGVSWCLVVSDGVWCTSGGLWCMSGGLWCMSGGVWCMSGGVWWCLMHV